MEDTGFGEASHLGSVGSDEEPWKRGRIRLRPEVVHNDVGGQLGYGALTRGGVLEVRAS